MPVFVTSRSGLWPELRELIEAQNPLSHYTIAVLERLKSELFERSCGQLVANQRILFYNHKRQSLFNRSVSALLCLIDWPQLMQSGLLTFWFDQLWLVGPLNP